MPFSLFVAIGMAATVASVCWLLSVLTREYSWVDRIWSVVPPIYIGWFAYESGFAGRPTLMFALTALWGARLTFNYARKGGYAPGGEDYRWAELRKRMPSWAYQVFNVAFIAGYQNALLLLITLPAYVALQHPAPLGVFDGILALLFLAFLVGETVSDQHQWNFHELKRAALARGETLVPPFNTTGFFKYSRHPNFLCEFSQWWVIYAFTLAAGAPPLNIGLLGPVLLTLLFDGSTRFTEALTLAKYPAYADYQKRTSRWIPLPPK